MRIAAIPGVFWAPVVPVGAFERNPKSHTEPPFTVLIAAKGRLCVKTRLHQSECLARWLQTASIKSAGDLISFPLENQSSSDKV